MEFSVIEKDSKCSIKISDEGMVLLQFYWKDKPSKSKKGNLNMAWCSQAMFNKIIEEYNKQMSGTEVPF